MKKIYFLLICGTICSASVNAQNVATFEDLELEKDSYWNGADLTGSFNSGDYSFGINYNEAYASWDGIAYSTMTATGFESYDPDQYNSCIGHGYDASQTFAVVYYSAWSGEPAIKAINGETFEAKGCYITNAAYAYHSMLNGDDYAKKFDDTDWFKLTATGYLAGETTGTADFYLAKDGKIVNSWEYFDLQTLATVDEIHFTLSSSDIGEWGMNTPAYFCMDDFGAEANTDKLATLNRPMSDNQIFDLMGRSSNNAKGLIISGGKACFVK